MDTQFLDRLAGQLKIGKDAPGRRAIERILDLVRTGCESGHYPDPTAAERAFRQMVEPGGDEIEEN